MRTIFAILLTVMLIASMTVSAYAATPKLDLDLPEIPDISGTVKVEIPDTVWDNWFKEHPIKIDFSKIKLWGWN
jgi:hypothetical protein